MCVVKRVVVAKQRIYSTNRPDDASLLAQLRAVVKEENWLPSNAQDVAGRLFYTCFMGTK